MMQILHISDIHFGLHHETEKSTHFFVRKGKPDPGKLAAILTRDPTCQIPDAIVVSGDLGWSGVADDYKYAASFFTSLRQRLPSVPLIIIPGNHDVDRSLSLADDDRQDAYIDLIKGLYGDEFEHLYPFYGKDQVSKRQSLVAFRHVDDELLIVGANSAASLTTDSVPVYVEPDILDLLRERSASLKVSDRALRVFVVHHHLLPFAEPVWGTVADTAQVADKPDPTIVANSAKLQTWLAANRFHLVLHGHKHVSHGRNDILWREGDPPDGRRLFVVGAGSAGVFTGERGQGELLSYNVINSRRLADARWDIAVAVRKINDNQAVQAATESYQYGAQIGPPAVGVPTVFSTQRMDECHQAIAASTLDLGPIRNFVSVVEDHGYIPPPTARLGDRPATAEEVMSSFRALHPEWDPKSGWDDADRVARELRNVPSRFQFEHGPRLFGTYGRAGLKMRGAESGGRLQPLRHAVETLKEGSTSRAYAGLYNAEIDIASGQQPLPGLMSVQFVPDGRHLDAVATFRKLELSFWWAVNMLKVGEMLRWAAKQDSNNKRQPRRITFFAALAEWKHYPEATFVTELDHTPFADLVQIVSQASDGHHDALRRLTEFIRDKIARTNDRNIDDRGLHNLVSVMDGILRTSKAGARGRKRIVINEGLLDQLRHAAEQTVIAREDEEKRVHALEQAKAYLESVLQQLTTT